MSQRYKVLPTFFLRIVLFEILRDRFQKQPKVEENRLSDLTFVIFVCFQNKKYSCNSDQKLHLVKHLGILCQFNFWDSKFFVSEFKCLKHSGTLVYINFPGWKKCIPYKDLARFSCKNLQVNAFFCKTSCKFRARKKNSSHDSFKKENFVIDS